MHCSTIQEAQLQYKTRGNHSAGEKPSKYKPFTVTMDRILDIHNTQMSTL